MEAAAAMAMMRMMIRRVKASKMVMGNLKIRPFCTVIPPPPPAWEGTGVPDHGGSGIVTEEEEEALAKIKEERDYARSQKPRGARIKVEDVSQHEEIKHVALFGLDEINQRQLSNLQLVKLLGAWMRVGPGLKYDITLEATDGEATDADADADSDANSDANSDAKSKFYRISVTNLYTFLRYTKLELVQWELLDHPYPITYFESGTDREYIRNMLLRIKVLRNTSRPFVICPKTARWWSDPCVVVKEDRRWEGGWPGLTRR